MSKQWQIDQANPTVIKKILREVKTTPLLANVLAQRNLTTGDRVKSFLFPELSQLHDPFLMRDMDKAVSRLHQAITGEEKILIYGDYDIDGTTSVAMMYSFLQDHHTGLDYYIPDRNKEGYGISLEGIDYAKQNRVRLMIALDCGINAVEAVEKANHYNIDVIICDHHIPQKELPPAIAILDPKRPDCAYPFKDLSGCAVGFKLCQAYTQEHHLNNDALWQLLDLVAVSIAGDIVPMRGENRVLTYFGLKMLSRTKRPGIKALVNVSKRKLPLLVSDIVFGIGPIINATGRLSHAHDAVRLLLATNDLIANEYAKILSNLNRLRKEMDEAITDEAIELFRSNPDWEVRKTIVVYKDNWHKGLIGIVASRLVEKFYRPAIVLTESNGKAVGSGRSIKGFDMYENLTKCADLISGFGGHRQAAGMTIELDKLDQFSRKFEQEAEKVMTTALLTPKVHAAGYLDFKHINLNFYKRLKKLAPFGPGNRTPVFVTKKVRDTGHSKATKGGHLQLAVKQGSHSFYGIAFGMGEMYDTIKSGKPFDICYSLQLGSYQGNEYLQLMIKDIKVNSTL